MFPKGDKFCNFLFASLGSKALPKKADPSWKEFASLEANSFHKSWPSLRRETQPKMEELLPLKMYPLNSNSLVYLVSFLQVINKILYSGSSDHTGRAWVTEFGDCTRIYKGHKHTVSVIKMKDGLGR